MTNLAKKMFSKEDLESVSSAITEAEKATAGEIRVTIRQQRGRRESTHSIERLAHKEFHALGMTETEGKTGVLILLLLAERRFTILADEGIHSKVGEGTWQRIADEMSTHFSKKNFRDGLVWGVNAVGRLLAAHVPRKASDDDELPNNVRIK